MQALLSFLTQWIGSCAKRTLEREKPMIIAITGTVGKSSTKQMLAAMLHADDHASAVRAPKKNYNNQIGVPLTVFNHPAPGRSPLRWLSLLWTALLHRWGVKHTGIKTFVFEMGADHPGDLAYLTSIAKPTISVITAITPEDTTWAPVHAANYPTIDDLAYEKGTLARNVDPAGTIILNADDPRVMDLRHSTTAKYLTFGTTESADIQLMNIAMRTEETVTGRMPLGLEATFTLYHRTETVYIPGVFGRSQAMAMAAALAVGYALDLPIKEMTQSLAKAEAPPGRVRLIPGIKGTMLLDDSYNASPVAVLSALRDLASMDIDASRQRRIVCLGEMRELGEQSQTLHEIIGMQVARLGMDVLAVTGAYAEAYARGAKLAGMHEDAIKLFDDTPELALWIQDILRPGDLVLAKASEGPMRTSEGFLKTKGVRMERVIKELMADPSRAAKTLCRQEPLWLREA